MRAYVCYTCRAVQYTQTHIIPFCPACRSSDSFVLAEANEQILSFNIEVPLDDIPYFFRALDTVKDKDRKWINGWLAIFKQLSEQMVCLDDGSCVGLHLHFEKSAMNAMLNELDDLTKILYKRASDSIVIGALEELALHIEQELNALN